MVGEAKKLADLERVARLISERELRQFSALSNHVNASRKHVGDLRNLLEQSYRSDIPLSVAEARIANAQAGRAARELLRAEHDLSQMMPGFERARQKAARAFGRAEALRELSRKGADRE